MITITPRDALARGLCRSGVTRAMDLLHVTDEAAAVPLTTLLDCDAISISDCISAVFVASRESRREYRMWVADIYDARRLAAWEVLPLFERRFRGDQRPRAALEQYPILLAKLREWSDGAASLDDVWRSRYHLWCRSRLRARVAGAFGDVAADPVLMALLAELREAVAGQVVTP